MFSNNFQAGSGTVSISATDFGDRVTPLQPHDRLNIQASIQGQGTYDITVSQPMVDDPLGRFTTWWGVGLGVEHHGRSGIGTSQLPPIKSKFAAFGIGDLKANGRIIASSVMVHVMTADEGIPGKFELDVVDMAEGSIPGLPDGHLRVIWDSYQMDGPGQGGLVRYVAGIIVIVLLITGALFLNRSAI
jgi:hypothetical protein